MNVNEDTYKTSDLGLATSLSASGFIVIKVDKSNSRRVVFCFKTSEDLVKAVDAYWNNGLLISGQSFMEHLKSLKARIYG